MLLPAPEADRAPALHCWPQSYQRTVELLCNVTVITEMQVKASVGYEDTVKTERWEADVMWQMCEVGDSLFVYCDMEVTKYPLRDVVVILKA